MNIRLVAIILAYVIAFSLPGSVARATEVFAGAQIQAAAAAHRIRGGTASGPAAAATIEIMVRAGRFDVTAQVMPASPTYSVPPGNGFQNIHVLYSNAMLRYWFSSRLAVGIGESIWNQRTYYNYARFGETDTFATRTVGTEYEVIGQAPLHNDTLRLDLRVDPSMHGVESDRGDPFLPLPTRFERAGAIDAAVSWIHHSDARVELEAGLRYAQLSAKYDDNSFAYASRVVGPFARIWFRL